MNIRKLGFPTICAALYAYSLPAVATAGALSPSASISQVSIATRLNEVQRGTYDGRDYLSINIGGHDVGPSSCRSNILRMHTSNDTPVERQEQIEAVALSAMLNADTVMIVIPLDVSQCVDGKPTFIDLYVLPASL